MMNEKLFLLQNHTTYPVYSGRNFLTLEFPDILVSPGAVIVTLILMKPQVKFSAVLYHCFIQRR